MAGDETYSLEPNGGSPLVAESQRLSALQGKLPHGLHSICCALVPVINTGIAKKKMGVFAGTAKFAFDRRYYFLVGSKTPGSPLVFASDECLITPHAVPFTSGLSPGNRVRLGTKGRQGDANLGREMSSRATTMLCKSNGIHPPNISIANKNRALFGNSHALVRIVFDYRRAPARSSWCAAPPRKRPGSDWRPAEDKSRTAVSLF